MENELFETAPIKKAYFALALPVVLSMVLTLIYNLVDTYFIAMTNNTDLIAGVSLGAPVFTLMLAIGDILGLGGSSLLSRLLGEKMEDDVARISSFCFWGSFAIGVLVTVLMLLFRTPILYLLGADADTFAYASQYYTWLVLGAPFVIFSLAPSNILRTEGLAKESMVGSMVGVILNMILDPIFISVLGLGAAGAAMASVLGYVVSSAAFVWILRKKSHVLSVNPRIIRVHRTELLQLLAIGIPASITNLTQSFGIMLTNRYLLRYGSDKIAAMGIVMKITMIAVLLLVGFSFGAQPLIGYNYGANNKKRLREIIRFAYTFELSLALLLSAVLMIFANTLMKVFVNQPAIISAGTTLLRCQLSSMVLIGFIMITSVICQSIGDSMGALLLSINRQGILFAAVIICLNHVLGYQGVAFSQPIADLLTGVLALFIVLRTRRKISD